MSNRDAAHLAPILELAGLIEERLDDMSCETFLADRHEIDLAAYRLAMIGETANKLSAALKPHHPQIEWAAIYGMRNIIAHDYGRVDGRRLWGAVAESLPLLVAVCRAEKDQA